MDDIRHYMLEMLRGIKTLKTMGIYHRDIKPHNFLYNIEKKRGIIIDFGLGEIDEAFFESVVKAKFKEASKKVEETGVETIEFLNQKEELSVYKRLTHANKVHGTSKIGT